MFKIHIAPEESGMASLVIEGNASPQLHVRITQFLPLQEANKPPLVLQAQAMEAAANQLQQLAQSLRSTS
jgi:hypothetical protein